MKRMSYAAVVLAMLIGAEAAWSAETVSEALAETKTLINWRLRYEGVDQTGFAETADALTSRLRTGFQTGDWRGTDLLGELVWTEDVVDNYNSTTNGQSMYPVVADPGGFVAVNRFALTNKSLQHTALTFGRQRIVHDNARFIGNVGWRQNEQTYDGLRAQIGAGSVDVDLAYIGQVNRIFGPDSPSGKWNGDVVLANVSTALDAGTLTGFAYALEFDEAAALSSNTLGLRFSGAKPVGALTALYTVSFARQSDAGKNPSDFSEDFYFVEGGLKFGKVTLALGLEVLGSDGVNRVTTPLATLHAFQGWADKFLATPPAGIDDRFLRWAYQAGRVGPFESLNLAAVWHDFDADFGAAQYGDELDLSVVARAERMTFTLKYAAYDAEQLLTDTDKFWLSLDYSF